MSDDQKQSDTHPSGAPWRNFYGRFKGKGLRKSQEAYLDEDLARLSPGPVSWEENPDRTVLDLAALFGARDVWLEVGFGGGEHDQQHVHVVGGQPDDVRDRLKGEARHDEGQHPDTDSQHPQPDPARHAPDAQRGDQQVQDVPGLLGHQHVATVLDDRDARAAERVDHGLRGLHG